ncbi:MAG: ribonuclease III [Deltaproteobacteria bacterium]|nr:ribonuclease III [Deltaproteobacteria bacterium]
MESDGLYKSLGYRFKDPELLLKAFRHSSYINEQPGAGIEDNERLEFLGDSVLDLAVSHILMELFNDAEEGELSKFRASIVDEAGLCQVAQGLGLGGFILLGKGEEQSGGREKPSILANTLEALIGAIYIDAGFNRTMKIIRRLFSSQLKNSGSKDVINDFKSVLQEYTQQAFKTLPSYRLTGESGPSHEKTFEVELELNGKIISHGKGKSKKEAEQSAAKEAFFCLKAGQDIS